MTPAWCALVVACFAGLAPPTVFLPAARAFEQSPELVQTAAQEPKSIIDGRVFSAETNTPLVRARVELTLVGKEDAERTATTDLEGRFEFNHVPAGRYTLRASKAGFAALQYGQRLPGERARVIVLSDGQVVHRQDITLPRGAAISGRVVDDLGDPLEWAFVTLMRRQFVDGERRLVAVHDPVKTNDAGQYRIAGLAPGTYYIAALLIGPWVREFAQAGVAFAPGYYPTTATITQSQPVTLRLGQERVDIDIVLVPGRPSRVSGMVVDSHGRRVANANCSAFQAAKGAKSGVSSGQMATSKADGTFTIENLPPGEHRLSARFVDPATGEEEAAATTLTLGGGDIDGLVMKLTAGVKLTGRIRFDSDRDPTFAPSKISIIPESSGATRPSSTVSPAWDFEMSRVSAGRQRLRLSGLPDGWTVKQIAFQGRDVTDDGIDVPASEDVAGIDIVVTNRLTEIAGTVTNGQDHAAPQSTVLAFSEDREKWSSGRFVAVTRPDEAGHYSLKALPPGKYFVAALEYLEEADAHDPEILESVRGRAKRVTVEEGQAVAVDLRAIGEPRHPVPSLP